MMRLSRLFRFANAARLATYLIALWKLARHAETPTAAKLVALAVLAYAVSPIDLIPDFIPVLGQLDDLILLPLGILLVIRLIPPALMDELRGAAAARLDQPRPRSLVAALVIVALWLLLAAWLGYWILG